MEDEPIIQDIPEQQEASSLEAMADQVPSQELVKASDKQMFSKEEVLNVRKRLKQIDRGINERNIFVAEQGVMGGGLSCFSESPYGDKTVF